jgi:hypothetical protein
MRHGSPESKTYRFCTTLKEAFEMNLKEPAVVRMMLLLVAICAAFILDSSGQLFAQAGIDTGSVTGTVKDPSGALVVAASCTLTDTATGVTQNTLTTSAGAYAFPIVQVGTYTLKVDAKGFQGAIVNRIVVHLGSTNTDDVQLKVGAESVEVSVTSAAPLLQAQDASLGTTIDGATATELPLFGGSGGRNFMDLITTVPGVQYTGNNDSAGTFLIHGVQGGAVDVRVNGADDNAEVFGGITIPPIPDAIQEMKVETGNNDADLGHSYGTVVNVVTKQGSNKFEGSVWEYDENDMFNANDYFNKRSQLSGGHPNRPGRFKENEPGFVFGGPVVIPHIYDGHNKTFFTVDYQHTHYVATPSYTGTVPTALMQSSNFTNLVDTLNQSATIYTDGLGRTFQAGTIMDPSTTRAIPCGSVDPITSLATDCTATSVPKGVVGVVTDPNVNGGVQSAIIRDPYFHELGQPAGCPSLAGTRNWVTTIAAGPVSPSCFNQLPAGRIDPAAVKLLQLFPKTYNNVNINPNTGLSTAGNHSYSNNFYELTPQVVETQQYDVRLDQTFTDKDSAFLTFSHYNQSNQEQPPYQGPLEGGSSTPFWTTNPTYMVVLTETHVFNPHLINEFRASDEHNWNTRMDPGAIDNTFGTPAQFGIQGIPQTTNNGGLPTFSVGSSISSFGSRTNVTWQKVGAWQFSDSVTKIVGKHEWKFGAEYWWTYGNIAQLPFSKGNFSFGQFSNVPASGDGGPGMTDFLLEPSANVADVTYAAAGGLSTSTNELGGVNGYNGNNWNKSTYHAPYIAFYAVDNWKITPDLTFNLGIRDDYFGPYSSNGGTGSEGNFWMGGDGNEASGSAYYIAHDGCNVTMSPYFKGLLAYNNIPIICEANNAANKVPLFNFAPRVGFEYRVRPNLVVRAGAGVSYGAFNSIGYGGTLGTNYPFRVAVQNGPQYSYRPQSVSNGSTGATTPTIENLFNIVSMTNASNAYQPLGSVTLYGKPYNFKIPYTESLNLAVQWQFTPHDSIEARYVGNLGRQLESADPYHNAPRQALTPSTAAVNVPSIFAQQSQACYPNCYAATSPLMPDGTTTIPFPNMAPNEGPIENTEQISNYDAGELEYQHQFGGGFDMDANYTYAGCLADTQGGQQNEGGPAIGRYRADYDRCENLAAQVFNLRGVYDLPFGRGTSLLPNANGLVDAVVGGWKLIPSWTSQSGFRANIGCQGTIGGVPNAAGQFTGPWFQTSNTAWACDAPLVKGVNPYKPGLNDLARTKVSGWLNSAAFTAPTTAVTQNGQQDFTPWGVRGNQVYGPGWYDVDLSARKTLKVTEATKVEVIANAINAFNHVHMNNPGTSNYTQPQNETLSGGFGTITGDASNNGSGRIWEFAAKYDF